MVNFKINHSLGQADMFGQQDKRTVLYFHMSKGITNANRFRELTGFSIKSIGRHLKNFIVRMKEKRNWTQDETDSK